MNPTQSSAKFIIAGGFGVGKTTFIGAVSEVPPLRTEEHMTEAARSVDDLQLVASKTSTTVAMDFGRVTVGDDLILYLFGTPGQARFAFMWKQLAEGALGAIVLVDTRRLDESFASIDYFEALELPFIVAVNQFPDSPKGTPEQIRAALALREDVPLVVTDAMNKLEVKETVISLIDHLLHQASAREAQLQG